MATTLSGMGILWACLSVISSLMLAVGFYMPYWLQGELPSPSEVKDRLSGNTESTLVFVGLFRRCNYPRVVLEDSIKTVEIVEECGRYTTFDDIPSLAWKLCTVFVGVATALSLCISFTTVFACCIPDVFSSMTAKITGSLQLICALLATAACALYPHGWDSEEVKDICGGVSQQYALGSCNIQWGYYITIGAVVLILISTVLSFKATKHKALVYNV